jgi:hypothetical protein
MRARVGHRPEEGGASDRWGRGVSVGREEGGIASVRVSGSPWASSTAGPKGSPRPVFNFFCSFLF